VKLTKEIGRAEHIFELTPYIVIEKIDLLFLLKKSLKDFACLFRKLIKICYFCPDIKI